MAIFRGSSSKVKEGKSKGGKILLRLPSDLHSTFIEQCHNDGIPMNTVLINLIKYHLDKQERKQLGTQDDSHSN